MTQAGRLPTTGFGRFFFELREGARRQGNVIFALIFRELKTKSGQDSYGMLSLVGIILEPAISVLALTLFWYFLKRQEVLGVHVALFLAISATGFAIARRSFASIPRTVKGSRSFYSYPSVKPFDAIAARFTIELVLTFIGGLLVLFLIWWFLDLTISMQRFIEGMRIYAELICFAFGMSLILGIYGTRFPIVMSIFSNISRVMFFVSAVIHPASELPSQAQLLITWNPFAHAMELGRFYFLGIRPFDGASEAYLAGWALSFLAFGFVTYYANRNKVLER